MPFPFFPFSHTITTHNWISTTLPQRLHHKHPTHINSSTSQQPHPTHSSPSPHFLHHPLCSQPLSSSSQRQPATRQSTFPRHSPDSRRPTARAWQTCFHDHYHDVSDSLVVVFHVDVDVDVVVVVVVVLPPKSSSCGYVGMGMRGASPSVTADERGT